MDTSPVRSTLRTCNTGSPHAQRGGLRPDRSRDHRTAGGLERHDLWIGLNEEANTDFSERRRFVGQRNDHGTRLPMNSEPVALAVLPGRRKRPTDGKPKTGSDAARQKPTLFRQVLIDLRWDCAAMLP